MNKPIQIGEPYAMKVARRVREGEDDFLTV